MFKLRACLLLITLFALPFVLSACVTTPPAYAYYDRCTAQTSSFVDRNVV